MRLVNNLFAIQEHQERVKTLKEISQGNPITQEQYEQLMRTDILQRDENLVNYENILASSSFQHN